MPQLRHARPHFGQVLVVEHLVGLEVAGAQGVVGADGGAGAAAAGAGGGGHGHPAHLQAAQGHQGKLQGGGEASRRSDAPGARQQGPVPLRQAVDEAGEVLRAGVRAAVGLGEHLGVLQPEVSAQVHQQQALADAGGFPGRLQGGQALGQLAVRQGGEHDGLRFMGEGAPVHFVLEAAVDDAVEVGMGRAERLARQGPGGAPEGAHRRVGAEPAQQFAPAVAGGAENDDRVQVQTPLALLDLVQDQPAQFLGMVAGVPGRQPQALHEAHAHPVVGGGPRHHVHLDAEGILEVAHAALHPHRVVGTQHVGRAPGHQPGIGKHRLDPVLAQDAVAGLSDDDVHAAVGQFAEDHPRRFGRGGRPGAGHAGVGEVVAPLRRRSPAWPGCHA